MRTLLLICAALSLSACELYLSNEERRDPSIYDAPTGPHPTTDGGSDGEPPCGTPDGPLPPAPDGGVPCGCPPPPPTDAGPPSPDAYGP